MTDQPKQMLALGALALGTAFLASGCATPQPKAEQAAEPAKEEQAKPEKQEPAEQAQQDQAAQPEAQQEEGAPEQAQMAESEEERAAAGAERRQATYTVTRGDTLWDIAATDAIYGDPFAWPLIYKHNSDKIEDADLIYPGQEFRIQRGVDAAAFDAAVQHAKTRGAWSLGETERSDLEYLQAR